jgi:hypothetical protein
VNGEAGRPDTKRWIALVITLAGVLSVGLALWIATWGPGSDSGAASQRGGASKADSRAADGRKPTPSASSSPSASPSAEIECGEARSAFDAGDGVLREVPSVEAVHDAACDGDFDAMRAAINPEGFDGTGFSAAGPDDVIAAWKARDDGEVFLQTLVTALENKPEVSQGGLTFTGGGHRAVWARGAGTDPATQLTWSGYFDCTQPPDSAHPACAL